MKQQENKFNFNVIERIGYYNTFIETLDLKYWINLIYNYQKHHPISVHKSNAGGYQSESYLDKLTPFLPLVRLLQTTIDLINPNHHNVINSLWLNISPPLSYNNVHSHGSESLSGVLYFQTPPKSGCIEFYSPLDFNSALRHQPQPKEMILFPQNLYHSVEPNLSQEDRISIAFNLF